MEMIEFPQDYRHEDHPPLRNMNEVVAGQTSVGQRAADAVVRVMGSWRFVIIQSILLLIWIGVNLLAWRYRWDPYPFILMNLALSMQAAYAAPMILMSQNRQTERDRLIAANDFEVNQKAEREIRYMLDHLQAQRRAMTHLMTEVRLLREEIAGHRNSGSRNPGDASPGPTEVTPVER